MSIKSNKRKILSDNEVFDEFDVNDLDSVLAIASIYEAKQKGVQSEESNSPKKSRKICKFWESNIAFDPNNETRLEYLMRMPKLLFGCLNAGDNKSVRKLLEEAFLPDCQLRTSALGSTLTGLDKIRELFLSWFQACPDLIITHSEVEFNVRVVSCVIVSHGTRISEPVGDYLYDDLKYDKKNKSKDFVEQRKLLQSIRKAGVFPRFRGSEFVHFIVNNELTHIENFILIRKDIKVFSTSN
jgi:hypothetical protein